MLRHYHGDPFKREIHVVVEQNKHQSRCTLNVNLSFYNDLRSLSGESAGMLGILVCMCGETGDQDALQFQHEEIPVLFRSLPSY